MSCEIHPARERPAMVRANPHRTTTAQRRGQLARSLRRLTMSSRRAHHSPRRPAPIQEEATP